MKYALFEYYSKMVRSGYFRVAWAILQSIIHSTPIRIHEDDHDFFLSGSAIWLIRNYPYTHDKVYIIVNPF